MQIRSSRCGRSLIILGIVEAAVFPANDLEFAGDSLPLQGGCAGDMPAVTMNSTPSALGEGCVTLPDHYSFQSSKMS